MTIPNIGTFDHGTHLPNSVFVGSMLAFRVFFRSFSRVNVIRGVILEVNI